MRDYLMGMKRAILFAAVLAACGDNATPDAPRVNVVSYDNRPEYELGLDAWSALGFTAGDGGVDCEKHWYEIGQTDCTITIGIYRESKLRENYGIDGGADRYARTIVIDDRYTGPTLVHLAAHEIGHIILDTGTHLHDPADGIMRSGHAWTDASDDDYQLACDSIGICISSTGN